MNATMTDDSICVLGRLIGFAMARDAAFGVLPRDWYGLDERGLDAMAAAGIQPDTRAWHETVTLARLAFRRTLREGR